MPSDKTVQYKFPPLLPEFHVAHELHQPKVVQAGDQSAKGKDVHSSPPPSGSRSTGSPGAGTGLGPSSDHAEQLSTNKRSAMHHRLVKVADGARGKGKPASKEDESKSALRRCQDRFERLNQMNKMFESLADSSWSSSENRHMLSAQLRQNKYWPALKKAIERKRSEFLGANRHLLESATAPKSDLGLSARARNCSAEAENELRQFRALQQQSLSTLHAMLAAASAEVPLCQEEINAAACAARSAYVPAIQAFEQAVEKSGAGAAPGGGGAGGDERGEGKAGKRGHLSEEAVRVLEDWLVRHFDDPYPSEEEKARLVGMTGVTLRQINNWMSNARVRIWRPAVQALNN